LFSIVIWFAIGALTSMLSAQPVGHDQAFQKYYCALRVHMERMNGDPLDSPAGVPLSIIDSRTRAVLVSMKAKGGTAELCELSTDEPFDVAVGGDGCGQVVVKNLQLLWVNTVDIRVIYQPCFEMGEELPWYGCRVLVRIQDQDHKPITTAEVTRDESAYRVDSAGRWMTALHMDEAIRLQVSAPGFVPVERRLTCTGTSEPRQTLTIYLSK